MAFIPVTTSCQNRGHLSRYPSALEKEEKEAIAGTLVAGSAPGHLCKLLQHPTCLEGTSFSSTLDFQDTYSYCFFLILPALFLNVGSGDCALCNSYSPRALKFVFCSAASPHPIHMKELASMDPWLASALLKSVQVTRGSCLGCLLGALLDCTCTKRHL